MFDRHLCNHLNLVAKHLIRHAYRCFAFKRNWWFCAKNYWMMKKMKLSIGVLFLSVFLACNGQSVVINTEANEFKTLIQEGGVLLDVRTHQEVAKGHIPNASIIDFYDIDFERKIALIQKDKAVYVYCKSGGRSAKAAEMLLALGQKKVYNLSGGFMAWENQGHPVREFEAQFDENIHSLSIAEFQSVLTNNETVLVDFHTQWCVPCKKMAPIIDELEVELANSVKVLRIDMDVSKKLAKNFEVISVPTFILFDTGVVQWRHSGIIEKEEIKTVLYKHGQ